MRVTFAKDSASTRLVDQLLSLTSARLCLQKYLWVQAHVRRIESGTERRSRKHIPRVVITRAQPVISATPLSSDSRVCRRPLRSAHPLPCFVLPPASVSPPNGCLFIVLRMVILLSKFTFFVFLYVFSFGFSWFLFIYRFALSSYHSQEGIAFTSCVSWLQKVSLVMSDFDFENAYEYLN